jgi:hypothetical protein
MDDCKTRGRLVIRIFSTGCSSEKRVVFIVECTDGYRFSMPYASQNLCDFCEDIERRSWLEDVYGKGTMHHLVYRWASNALEIYRYPPSYACIKIPLSISNIQDMKSLTSSHQERWCSLM